MEIPGPLLIAEQSRLYSSSDMSDSPRIFSRSETAGPFPASCPVRSVDGGDTDGRSGHVLSMFRRMGSVVSEARVVAGSAGEGRGVGLAELVPKYVGRQGSRYGVALICP